MVKEVGSPMFLFENVDLTPIQPILWTSLHNTGPGRPVEYNPEWDLRPYTPQIYFGSSIANALVWGGMCLMGIKLWERKF